MLDWSLGFTMAEGECEEFWQRTARDLESGDLFWDEEEEIYFWDEEVELDGGQVGPVVSCGIVGEDGGSFSGEELWWDGGWKDCRLEDFSDLDDEILECYSLWDEEPDCSLWPLVSDEDFYHFDSHGCGEPIPYQLTWDRCESCGGMCVVELECETDRKLANGSLLGCGERCGQLGSSEGRNSLEQLLKIFGIEKGLSGMVCPSGGMVCCVLGGRPRPKPPWLPSFAWVFCVDG